MPEQPASPAGGPPSPPDVDPQKSPTQSLAGPLESLPSRAELPSAEGEHGITAAGSDPLSAMSPRFNLLFRWFAKRFFGHFELNPETVEKLSALEARGSVIYVMRYSSRLDYFLFNTLFLRVGLRLSSFANGLTFYYYRPVLEALRIAFLRKRGRPREIEHSEHQEHVRRAALSGDSAFLFLRTIRLRGLLRSRRKRRQDELDLLAEVVGVAWDSPTPVYLVPLALFWRKGPRSENRFLNLSYGAVHRPSDLAKVGSFLANYRSLAVKTGEPIDLNSFIAERRREGRSLVARKVRRSILMYLYREEKVVEGPTLRPPPRVFERVLGEPRVQAAIRARAAEKKSSPERAELEAEKMLREIAANMNSTFLAVLGSIVTWILRRMFASIDVSGLEKVAEYAKRHPLVLVPNHRSYFDFLIISLMFYQNFLVPPHIAARENMAFGPFGFVFRRVGAFFLRSSFDDPLYKEVFRAYVGYLVREGFTQEFFIEGGRSRTGKSLAPRLGILSWDVQAFLDSARRDLFFVPIAITYERLVEEGAMVEMLEGGKKQKESVRGLFRARKFLQRRFGSVHVNFAEPLSLADALGERRERFRADESDEVATERRQFIEQFGRRLVERFNWAAVANATSVAACVLLGSRHRGLLRDDLVARMKQVVELLRFQGVSITPALMADGSDFKESIAFLVRSDLIRVGRDPRGEILYFEESKRQALDIYRNSIAHHLAAPSFLARRLLAGGSAKELAEDLAVWLDILYQEFFVPSDGSDHSPRCEALLEHFQGQGWIARTGEELIATPRGEPMFTWLAEQTQGLVEAYAVVCDVIAQADEALDRKRLRELAATGFDNAQLLGEAARTEAANDTTFSNVVDLLVRRGILEAHTTPGRKGAKDVCYERGEQWDALGELRERLAGALCSPLARAPAPLLARARSPR